MTRFSDRDQDAPTPPSKRRRALFMVFLLSASTLVYLELILRFGG